MEILRTNVPMYIKKQLPECINEAKGFVKNKYPNVNFDNVDLIFNNGRTSHYFRNTNSNTYKNPVCSISCRNELAHYKKKSIGLYANWLLVGWKIQTISALIHELTHHMQYECGKNHGELETTKNEIQWLKNYDSFWYEKLTKI